MSSRCQYCAGLSIEHVLDLPRQPYASSNTLYHTYQHYERISDLVNSATLGCDLCQLIVTSLKKERTSNRMQGCEPPDSLHSYLLQREQSVDSSIYYKDAGFEFHLSVNDGWNGSSNPKFVQLRLASRAKRFGSYYYSSNCLRFRLVTHQGMHFIESSAV